MEDRTRSALVVLISVVAFGGSIFACLQHRVLWVLVPLPGLVGLLYHILSLQARYQNRANIAVQYRQFLTDFHHSWGRPSPPAEVSEDGLDDSASHQPRFSSTFWAAAVLTAVLAIPAAVSRGGFQFLPLEFKQAWLSEKARPAGNSSVGQGAAKPAGTKQAPRSTNEIPLSGGEEGLVYAGLGVYVLIVLRTIGRLNSGALHARFMMTAAMRSTVALALGYAVGLIGVGAVLPASVNAQATGQLVTFLIGLFYPLFVESLYRRAFTIFGGKQPVTDPLKVQMIQGVDDDVADILEELGITDVQHVASSDPAVLTLRSLYPFERVTDWISQAMLIRRFGDNIAKIRQLKVHGIVDWIPLMQPIVENTANAADAQVVLAKIAEAAGEPVEAIRIFGFAAYGDYKTNLFWNLWQHRKDVVAASADSIDETIRIAARLAAMKFRAANMDMVMASSDDVNAAFNAAMTIANDGTNIKLTAADAERKRLIFIHELEKELQRPAANS